MQITKSKTRYMPSTILIIVALFVWGLISSGVATADVYTDSAHGNTSYGVKRSGTGYTTGACDHCHDTFDPAICGQEGHPYMLFVDNDNSFCTKCHDNTTTYATTAIVNRSYSYRAGGWTDDTVNDIDEAFRLLSSHSLSDISTFITGKWKYTVDSNPCIACHNQHMAQGDPPNSPNAAKSPGTRGWPLARPGQHDTPPWGLWGDDTSERMNAYTSNYQAPYRYGSTTTYEPDGSATTDGSNLTDFNTFCTDCHNTTNTIYSTALVRNLRHIDWDNEKHGKGNADHFLSTLPPYTGSPGDYVLSCLDCHDPHGSPNVTLIRGEVNGDVVGSITTIDSSGCLDDTDHNIELAYLCTRCHNSDWESVHHFTGMGECPSDSDKPYQKEQCASCHGTMSGGGKDGDGMDSGGMDMEAINCNCCHYHGSYRGDCDCLPYTRRTF